MGIFIGIVIVILLILMYTVGFLFIIPLGVLLWQNTRFVKDKKYFGGNDNGNANLLEKGLRKDNVNGNIIDTDKIINNIIDTDKIINTDIQEKFNAIDKTGEPLIKYSDIKDTLKYRSLKNWPVLNPHVGWLKLLLSEIQFLTKYVTKNQIDNNEKIIVVYAGSAPATKIPTLNKLFPNVIWILIDPNEHILMYGDKTHYDEEYMKNVLYLKVSLKNRFSGNRFNIDDRKIHMYGDNNETNEDEASEDDKNSNITIINRESAPIVDFSNIDLDKYISTGYQNFIIEDYMTKKLCKELKNIIDKTKHPLYFISDIRTVDDETAEDIDILTNNIQQLIFIKELKPIASMLKFRCPYMEQQHTIDKYINNKNKYLFDLYPEILEKYRNGIFYYLRGDINLQAFPGNISTETRLIVDGENAEFRDYNPKEYEDKFFYYNRIERPFVFRDHNKKYIEKDLKNIGIDGCNDCAIMIKIFEDYFDKYKLSYDVNDILEAIDNSLNMMQRGIKDIEDHGNKVYHGEFIEPYKRIDEYITTRQRVSKHR